jgi:hypothetical protein
MPWLVRVLASWKRTGPALAVGNALGSGVVNDPDEFAGHAGVGLAGKRKVDIRRKRRVTERVASQAGLESLGPVDSQRRRCLTWRGERDSGTGQRNRCGQINQTGSEQPNLGTTLLAYY